MSDFDALEEGIKEAERRATPLRGRGDLDAMAQAAGQRYLGCQARLVRVGHRMEKAGPAKGTGFFEEGDAAGHAFDEASLEFLAILMAMEDDAASKVMGRLGMTDLAGYRPGVHRL
jgi:hypothetical protein